MCEIGGVYLTSISNVNYKEIVKPRIKVKGGFLSCDDTSKFFPQKIVRVVDKRKICNFVFDDVDDIDFIKRNFDSDLNYMGAIDLPVEFASFKIMANCENGISKKCRLLVTNYTLSTSLVTGETIQIELDDYFVIFVDEMGFELFDVENFYFC